MADGKRCACCEQVKPVADFAKHRTNGLQAYCRACSLQKSREWAAKNKDKKLQHKTASRHSDIERDRTNRRRHYANNAERLRAESRSRSPEDRMKRAERQRAYRVANPEKIRQMNRARVHTQRAAGKITRDMVESLITLQRGCCAACRRPTVKDGKGFHLDHKVSLAAGGTNEFGNLQILCPSCNLKKNDRDPVEFMQERGYLL